jgi:ubiquinone/menaquinone biosynthesis C-methylase UbiE
MTDIGKKNRENREEWLEATLKKIPAGLKILDAGAGELKYKKYCSHLDYVSQDFGQYNGTGDGAGQHTEKWDQTKLDIVSDITAIPRENNSFDAIMCIEVLEHIPEPTKALAEFSRLLNKGGALVVTVPFCSSVHMAPYHFFTGFTKYFLEKHLQANNFEILEITSNGDYYEFLAQDLRYTLFWVVDRYSNYSGFSFFRKKSLQFVSFCYRKIILPAILVILRQYQKIDVGSSEFSCFGYFVLARKK